MDRKLFAQAIAKFLAGVVLVGALLFIPAGTLAWPQGWRLMAVLFIPMFLAGVVMIRKNPELLRKRAGHKNIYTTLNTYVHPSEDEVTAAFKEAADRFRLPGKEAEE